MGEAHRPASEAAASRPFMSLSRRGFLGGSAAFVAAVLLGRRGAAAPPGKLGPAEIAPSLFVAIREDGSVEITCHRSEMGQQTWTAMTQLIVEELEVPWEQVVIAQAPGDSKYGDQNTDGSRSVRYNFERLRMSGAAMRTMLERAAANQWKVPASECRGTLGKVVHASSGNSLTYGALAAAAAKLPIPDARELTLKPSSEWRLIGKPVASVTVPELVMGKGTFGIDVRLPGMLYAVVARPPQVLGTIGQVDDAKTLAVPGVVKTVRLPAPSAPVRFQPLGGVAVIAKDTWSAIKGREALDIRWNDGPNAGYDSEAYTAQLLRTVQKPGTVRMKRGDVAAALAGASKRVAADYEVPHLAHAAMAPPAVTASWEGDRVILRGGIQAPQAARKAVAQTCGIDEEKVTILVTWLGGGFGRKSKPDFFAEAALIARDAGAPVKVIWTREDDLQHGYLHTVSAQHLEAGLDEKGRCTAWLHRTVFPPISSTFAAGADEASWGDLRQGASDTPFDVPNLQLESGKATAHVRIGWLRSVANIYHAFAVQSFADELAHAAGRDPLEYLLELIGPPRRVDPRKDGAEYDNYGSPMADYPIDTARMAAAVRKAAAMASWGRELPKGHGLGVAVHRSFVSYVATVVEVAVDNEGRLSIPGVWSAIDAGTVINPRHVESQLEGGTLFGLSNALYGEITARKGAIVQSNFPAFRVMRMNEAPRAMETTIIRSDAPPGGVGEPPTPPAAPALANAIFAATGVRYRRLPIFGNSRRDRIVAKPGGGS